MSKHVGKRPPALDQSDMSPLQKAWDGGNHPFAIQTHDDVPDLGLPGGPSEIEGFKVGVGL